MLANALTLSRIGIGAVFAIVLASAVRDHGFVSPSGAVILIVILLASEATDIFDGVVARKMGTAGPFGGILDPLCDSLCRLTVYFALALAGYLTIVVPFVMTARDIVVAYVRIFASMTGGKTSARPSGKIKAIVQGSGAPLLLLVAALGTNPPSMAWSRWETGVAAAVIAVTCWSLFDYLAGAVSAFRAKPTPR
jgi:CDP-diacylglycerol--glycerol-3-phosphate 3-phosphatidyltransferase